jgi:hypothetical protein
VRRLIARAFEGLLTRCARGRQYIPGTDAVPPHRVRSQNGLARLIPNAGLSKPACQPVFLAQPDFQGNGLRSRQEAARPRHRPEPPHCIVLPKKQTELRA